MAEASHTELFPEIEPYNQDWLCVSDLHEIYYEESGNKNGNPVVFVHGGPGSGTSPKQRQFFDPTTYRIVLVDQRGAGKSRPLAELRENTTWDLVSDLEKLREHLGIEKWVVLGGSWGSALSLTYAQTHPDKVKALIIGGIFTVTREELLWFYQKGASYIFPDAWETFLAPIPEVERGDMMSAYYRRLTGDDKEVQLACIKAWSSWKMHTFRLTPDEEAIQKGMDDVESALRFAKIECHYFVNGGFFTSNHQLLNNIDIIRHIPCTIIQGRYDVVTPFKTAWELHKQWPEAEFYVLPDAGHYYTDNGFMTRLLQATEKYKTL